MSRAVALGLAVVAGLIVSLPVRAADDGEKAAREILDNAIKAIGGADNLARMKSVTWKSKGKATSENNEIGLSEEWSAKAIDRYNIAVTATIGGNTINATMVIAPEKGWVKVNEKTSDLPKEAGSAIRNVARSGRMLHFLPALKAKPYELSALGELKVGDREAVGVRVSEKGRPDVSLYFDKKTGLPLKSEVRVIEMEGGAELLFEAYYSEYKDFDGIKHATRVVVKRDDKTFLESDLSDFKPQDLDDSLFDKP